MTLRTLRLLAAAVSLWALVACATSRPARHFAPASPETAREALAAWSASLARASELPASRLLYDARVSSGGAPPVPGTLAVTYDGKAVVTASLTGPFGSRIAEYRDGALSGKDRSALLVDPQALRAVLAGTWNGQTPSVEGCDAGQCEVAFDAEDVRALVVLDVATRAPISLDVTGLGGHLVVEYAGEAKPWPDRMTVREETTHRSLSLRLLAVEPAGAGVAGR